MTTVTQMSKEERERLFLHFNDYIAADYALKAQSDRIEKGSLWVSRFKPIKHNRSIDCMIAYNTLGQYGAKTSHRIFVRFKPTSQSYLDAMKQLNQDENIFDNDTRLEYEYHKVIVTYDWNTDFDAFLKSQYIDVYRPSKD